MNAIGDLHSLTTYDGKQTFFPDDQQAFLVFGHYGAPPTEFQTRRGFRQDGATEVGYILNPRRLNVQLWRAPSCSRQAYWDMRAALHEFLRPNRGGPLVLTLRQPSGAQRALTVRANPGLIFVSNEDNDWNVDEPLELIAFDPIWHNPVSTVLTPSADANDQLVFPIEFPIYFGGETAFYTASIDYDGTWAADITITLTGPFAWAYVENTTTGISFTLRLAVGAGETRIIHLSDTGQSVMDDNGGNRFNELSADSNLVDFAIEPAPIAQQDIHVRLGQAGVGSGVEIAYRSRYFAL